MASNNTRIEWTEQTWNPIVGCSRVSPGCANCYAERMSARLAAMAKNQNNPGRKKYYLNVTNDRGHWNHEVVLVPEALNDPLNWKTPSTVFVNSMSDIFHERLSLEQIAPIFDVMNRTYWHKFQALSKRSERLLELSPHLRWSANIWMGVSVENQDYLYRVDHLRQSGAAVKFLSLEPLLGPLSNLNLDGIDWAIVGGESGPGARPMDRAWVREIRDQCLAAKVPLFFKQWGHSRNNPDPADPTDKKNKGSAKGGNRLDGVIWNQLPVTPVAASPEPERVPEPEQLTPLSA
jgi:protein gp37